MIIMEVYVKYIIMIMSTLLVLSCNQKVIKQEVKQDEVLATWRGGQVTDNEFNEYLESNSNRAELIKYYDDSLKNELTTFILKKIAIGMIDSLRLDTVENINKSYNNYLSYLSAQKLMDDSVRNKVITPGLIRKIYEKKKYSYRISHILLSEELTHDITIDSIYLLLLQKPDLFDNLARKHSDDKPTSTIGGNLGWYDFDDIFEEFKDYISPDLTGKVSKPIKTKFGKHILKINEIKSKNDIKTFREEKNNIIQHLDKKYSKELELSKEKFDDFLFKKYNIKIDTVAVDICIFLCNYYLRKGYNIEEQIKSLDNEIILSQLGNFKYTPILLKKFHLDLYPDLTSLDRYQVSKGIHYMFHRTLLYKAVKDLNNNIDSELIYRAKMNTAEEYIKYIIYQYFVPKIVTLFENKEIENFPSFYEMNIMWQKTLFQEYNVVIK